MNAEASKLYLELSDEIIPDISMLADLPTNVTDIPLEDTVSRAGRKIIARIEEAEELLDAWKETEKNGSAASERIIHNHSPHSPWGLSYLRQHGN